MKYVALWNITKEKTLKQAKHTFFLYGVLVSHDDVQVIALCHKKLKYGKLNCQLFKTSKIGLLARDLAIVQFRRGVRIFIEKHLNSSN